MFRIKDLPFHLAGEEDRRKPPGGDTPGATSKQPGLLCSCFPTDHCELDDDGKGDGEGEKDRQQDLLRQQLRRELGEARP
jgi:hypothetical protein